MILLLHLPQSAIEDVDFLAGQSRGAYCSTAFGGAFLYEAKLAVLCGIAH